MSDLISREAAVESALDMLDGFRSAGQMDYSAYSELHDAISLLDSTPWVSVRDRLPPKVGAYLVCESDGNMETADYHAAANTLGNFYRYFRGQCEIISDVTHWMKLPAPPVD